ncbi:MAG: GNAT family N-acetyltransferase [Candidatus Bathyarchaeota archaeon]|nr:GNAT family N-acetyltransferase [Candidatus Bathyarchaeota archaeon]
MAYPAAWEKTYTAKNGAKILFRPEKAADTEMLWEMYSSLLDATTENLVPPFTRQRIEGWTQNIDYSSVLAIVAVTEDAHIVATASLKFSPQEVFRHKAELGITVHDSYQNLGIGTELLMHLLSIAKEKQLKKIFLTVNVNNAKAQRLYHKAGFTLEGTLRGEMQLNGKFIDEYRMALFL